MTAPWDQVRHRGSDAHEPARTWTLTVPERRTVGAPESVPLVPDVREVGDLPLQHGQGLVGLGTPAFSAHR